MNSHISFNCLTKQVQKQADQSLVSDWTNFVIIYGTVLLQLRLHLLLLKSNGPTDSNVSLNTFASAKHTTDRVPSLPKIQRNTTTQNRYQVIHKLAAQN